MTKVRAFRKLGNFCKKHWRKWTILAILFIIAFIAFIFYECIYKPVYKIIQIEPQKLEIKKKVYSDVMDSYYERQNKVDEIMNKVYPNPFK